MYASIGVILGKIFGLKSIIVIGGVDMAKEPELKYGIWLSRWKSFLVGYAIRNANKILVVDPSLAEEAKNRASYEGKNITYLPTGYDSTYWKPLGEKENFVLTVSAISDEGRFIIKGIPYLIETARLLPDIKFVIIGVNNELATKWKPPRNIIWLGKMEQINLLYYYQRAKVYCQPSLREGLPNTVCEAMLCGCIPIGTDAGGIPTAIGNCGIIVPKGDVYALKSAIQQGIGMSPELGMQGRARIIALFPKEKRERGLIQVINEFYT